MEVVMTTYKRKHSHRIVGMFLGSQGTGAVTCTGSNTGGTDYGTTGGTSKHVTNNIGSSHDMCVAAQNKDNDIACTLQYRKMYVYVHACAYAYMSTTMCARFVIVLQIRASNHHPKRHETIHAKSARMRVVAMKCGIMATRKDTPKHSHKFVGMFLRRHRHDDESKSRLLSRRKAPTQKG